MFEQFRILCTLKIKEFSIILLPTAEGAIKFASYFINYRFTSFTYALFNFAIKSSMLLLKQIAIVFANI